MIEIAIAICIGLGLSASCGFRVFVPMLMGSLAGRFEIIELSSQFAWMESTVAISVFAIATVIEIGAYYLPWLDNLLDSISIPASVIAGVILAAACFGEMDPLIQWSLATIAGGTSAGIINLGVSGIRLGSSLFSGGLTNGIVSTAEWVLSFILALLAIFVPILAAAFALLLVFILFRFAIRFINRRRNRNLPESVAAKS